MSGRRRTAPWARLHRARYINMSPRTVGDRHGPSSLDMRGARSKMGPISNRWMHV